MANLGDKPWFHKGLRFECQRCGRCCTARAGRGGPSFVYLEEADIEALRRHLGLERAEFLARYTFEERGWTCLVERGTECVFLEADRSCGVYPARPRQCSTFPFWRENLERATWEGALSELCPGIGRGPLHTAAEIERTAREDEGWPRS